MGPFDIAMKTQMHPIITECVFVRVYVCVRGGGGLTGKADCYHNNPAPVCLSESLLDEMW